MIIRELFVRLGVDSQDAEDALDQVDDAVGQLSASFGDLIGFLAKAAAGFAAVTGAAGAVAAKTAEWSEEIVRNSDALGMSTDKYQELHFAFRNLGASTDDMMDAFSTLTDRALDAAEGSKTYIDEFERVGIAVDDLKGKRPDQLFDMYVKATANAQDRTAAVATAVRLFGDDLGRRIVPALTTSAESFEQWREIARSTGIVMDEALVRKAREVRMNMRALEGRFMALVYTLGHKLMPFVDKLVRNLNTFIDRIQSNAVATQQFSDFARMLTDDLQKMTETIASLTSAFGVFDEGSKAASKMYVTVKGIVAVIASVLAAVFASSLITVIKAIATLFGAATVAAGAKVWAIIAGIAAVLMTIFYVAEDIYGWIVGWDSATGRVVDNFGDGAGILDSLAVLAQTIRDYVEAWIPVLVAFWTWLWDYIVYGFKILWKIVEPFLAFFLDLLSAVFALSGAVAMFIQRIIEGDWMGAFVGIFQDIIAVVVNLVMDAVQQLVQLLSSLVQMVLVKPFSAFMDMLQAGIDALGLDMEVVATGDEILEGYENAEESFMNNLGVRLATSSESPWVEGGDMLSDMSRSPEERREKEAERRRKERERERKRAERREKAKQDDARQFAERGIWGSLVDTVSILGGGGDSQAAGPGPMSTAGLPLATAVPQPVARQKSSPEIFIETIQVSRSLAAEEEKANMVEVLSRAFKMASSSASGGER